MRAVVEQKSHDGTLPPIEVLVAAGKESVTIKVSVNIIAGTSEGKNMPS